MQHMRDIFSGAGNSAALAVAGERGFP